MDALLLIDTTAPAFSADSPAPLVELIGRVRSVAGVLVHVAAESLEDDTAAEAASRDTAGEDDAVAEGAAGAAGGGDGRDRDSHSGDRSQRHPDDELDDEADEADESDEAEGPAAPAIDTVYGTGEEELVLVSEVPDAFEGIPDLAPGLGDLGVGRLLIAGGDGRGAVYETAMAALVLGFEVIVLSDAALTAEGEPVAWADDAEAAGAVVRSAAGLWLKM